MKKEDILLWKGCYFNNVASWGKLTKKRMVPPGKLFYFYSLGYGD